MESLAGRDIGGRSDARAIHDQRAGVGIEEVIAHGEAFRGAPGFARFVADLEFRMGAARLRGSSVTRGLRVGGAHEYSHSG